MNLKLRIDHVEAVILPVLPPIHPNSSLEENRNRFKRAFDSKKEEKNTMNYAFEVVRCEINQLTGEKIGKSTV